MYNSFVIKKIIEVKALMKISLGVLVIVLIFMNCESKQSTATAQTVSYEVNMDTLNVWDSIRDREIPIAIYAPSLEDLSKLPIVIMNPGYNSNQPGAYLGYSYLTEELCKNGYFVVSIEHDLITDDTLVLEGFPRVVRMPSWKKGNDNILAVLHALKKTYPMLNYKKTTLIGHSNGGDMAVLCVTRNEGLVDKLITLDHRRMPLPKTKSPKIYSLRSNDQKADENVLPKEAEATAFDMKIVQLKDIGHNDMSDAGTVKQKNEISRLVLEFLKE